MNLPIFLYFCLFWILHLLFSLKFYLSFLQKFVCDSIRIFYLKSSKNYFHHYTGNRSEICHGFPLELLQKSFLGFLSWDFFVALSKQLFCFYFEIFLLGSLQEFVWGTFFANTSENSSENFLEVPFENLFRAS